MKTHPQAGWPPDGSPGEWLGWDAQGRLSILRWCSHADFNGGAGAWVGVRFDRANGLAPTDRQWPLAFVRAPDTECYVVKFRPAIGARGE